MSEQRRPKVVQAGHGLRLHVHGIEFIYKTCSPDTDNQYALAVGIVPPNHGTPMHVHHREDEAFYILKGEFEIECGSEKFKAGPGTFALLPKDLPHRLRNLSTRPGKILCVQSPGGVEEFFEHLSVFAHEALPLDLTRLAELAERYGIEFVTADVTEQS